MRVYAPGVARGTRKIIKAAAVNTNLTGIVISYTVPTGKSAFIRRFTFIPLSGAPQGRLALVSGGSTLRLSGSQTAALLYQAHEYFLSSGDTIQFNVTTAGGAGSTSDLTFSLEEEC